MSDETKVNIFNLLFGMTVVTTVMTIVECLRNPNSRIYQDDQSRTDEVASYLCL